MCWPAGPSGLAHTRSTVKACAPPISSFLAAYPPVPYLAVTLPSCLPRTLPCLCPQDKLAFWSALYFQLLSSFAINGSFLASDGNLLASLAAAVLLRTGPLMLAELRARTAAAAAAGSGGGSGGGGGN